MPVPILTAIDRPRCPRCQSRMDLRTVAPGPHATEARTFECEKCGGLKVVTIPQDPLHSETYNSMIDALRPPT